MRRLLLWDIDGTLIHGGDTAADLACARAGGVRCLLVGTGAPGWEGVRDLDADHVLPDLSDVDHVVEVLSRG